MASPTWVLGALVLVGATAGCSALVAADFDGLGPKAGADAGVATSADGTTDETGPAAPPPSSPSSPPSAPSADGGTPTPSKDAAAPHCVGTAKTCAALASQHTACVTQAGCTWSAQACELDADCFSKKTASTCNNTDGCETDFATSTCVEISGYCVGTTRAACESNADCSFTGGCAGSAKKCADLAEEASCLRQGGCAWQ